MSRIKFHHKKLLYQCQGLKILRISCSIVVLLPWLVGEIAWALSTGGFYG